MLTAILGTLRSAGRPLTVAELSRDVAIEPSALEGMLDTLVARGRLRVLAPHGGMCGACPVKGGCTTMEAPVSPCYALPDSAMMGAGPEAG